MSDQTSTELTHYGVLGMKWGVRKARREGRSLLRAANRAKTDAEKRDYEEKYNRKMKEIRLAEMDYEQAKSDQRIKTGKRLAVAAVAIVGTYAISKMMRKGSGDSDTTNNVKDTLSDITDNLTKTAKGSQSAPSAEKVKEYVDVGKSLVESIILDSSQYKDITN